MNDWLIYGAAGATLLAILLARKASRPASRRDSTPDAGAPHARTVPKVDPKGSPDGLSILPGGLAVDCRRLLCTCEEWRTRRARFKPEDPRRLCVHLCQALAAHPEHMPEALMPFAPCIALMRDQEHGVPFEPPSFAFVLEKTGYVVTMPPAAHPWAMIYAGRAIHALNIQNGQWGDSGAPPNADDLSSLIRSELRRRMSRAGSPAGA